MRGAPQLGDTVIYTSEVDSGVGNDVRSPAIVIRTKATTVSSVVERDEALWPDEIARELGGDYSVDLVVFGLIRTYRRYNVAMGPNRGEWVWPEYL